MPQYNKYEIMNMLEAYHNTISDEPFERANTEEFLNEYLQDIDRAIERSFTEIDFDFDDL